MAGETEGQEPRAALASGVDMAAAALALGGASREKANEFLDEQIALTRLQKEELAHELKLRFWSLRLHHSSSVLKLAFEVSLALIAIVLAWFIGAAVWNAAHADGPVVEAFSVPTDMAARGLTGEVVASRMLDRLTAMQNATNSERASRSYANDWGNDIKVEIPETGISFGEAYRYLTGWLGHETHLSGEVVRTADGITLTARLSDADSTTFTGPETKLNALIDQAAEHIYGRTQPYRYARYLSLTEHRFAEAAARFKALTVSGSDEDRYWAYVGLGGQLAAVEGDYKSALALFERAVALQPDNPIAISDVVGNEINLDRPERALRDLKKLQAAINHGRQQSIRPDQFPSFPKTADLFAAQLTGDFGRALQERKQYAAILGLPSGGPGAANLQVRIHDLAAARASNAMRQPGPQAPTAEGGRIVAAMRIKTEAQDWTAVASHAGRLDSFIKTFPKSRLVALVLTSPLLAHAQARLGNFAAADAEIAKTPIDCDNCLRTRARIAELEGKHGRADYWFARAVKAAPDIPFAYADWGQALLGRGQPDAAIAKLKIANQKGPHFADALEGWAEALMAKNRSDLALAKFEEANKYAPKWGRLHLKWGEALFYAGRKDDSRAQYRIASGLSLSKGEKIELESNLSG
jgi:tetratricopeptide (TPR) repeat protein